ncbi:MAG: hypothetical protein MJ244_06515 [Clostridia bacterium]|nr:hypothetical protein [Clostridia bacterium]
MKKVYLMNEMYDIIKALDKKEEEIVTLFYNEKILNCIVNNNGEYSMYRKERVTFLETKEEEISITENEYETMKRFVAQDNIDDLFIKHTFIFDDNQFFNIYGGKYNGLVTLEVFYDDDLDELEYKDINGIDITDNDIANDMKLLNMNCDEVQNEIAQLRIQDTNLF